MNINTVHFYTLNNYSQNLGSICSLLLHNIEHITFKKWVISSKEKHFLSFLPPLVSSQADDEILFQEFDSDSSAELNLVCDM